MMMIIPVSGLFYFTELHYLVANVLKLSLYQQ